MSDFYDTSSATPSTSTSQITYGEEITLPASSSTLLYFQPVKGPVSVSPSPPRGHTVGHAENHNHAPSNGSHLMPRSTSNDSSMSLASSNGGEEGEVREVRVKGSNWASSHDATRYSTHPTQQSSYSPSWHTPDTAQHISSQWLHDLWAPTPWERPWQPGYSNDLLNPDPVGHSSDYTAWQSTDLPYSRSYTVKKKTARNMTWVPPPIPTEDYPPPPPMPPPPTIRTPDYSHLPFVPQSWQQMGNVLQSSSSGNGTVARQAASTRQTKPLPKHKSSTNLSAQAVPFSSPSSSPSLDATPSLPPKPTNGGSDSKAALRALLLNRKVELERLNLKMAQNTNASGPLVLEELEDAASSRSLPPPPASLPRRPAFSPEQSLEPELHTSKSTPDMLYHASLPSSTSAPMSLGISPSPSQPRARRRPVATDFESDPTEALRPQTAPLANTSRHADMVIMLSDSDSESSSDDERQYELVPLREAAAESKEQDLRCHRPFQPQFAVQSYSAAQFQSYNSRATSEQEDDGHSWQTTSKRTSLIVRRPATSRTSSFTNQSVSSTANLSIPIAGPSSLPATALRHSPAGSGTPEPPQMTIQPVSSSCSGTSASAGSDALLLAKQNEIRKMMDRIKALESRKRQKTTPTTGTPSLRSTPEISTSVPQSLPPAIAGADAVVKLDKEKSPPSFVRPVEDHATKSQRQRLLKLPDNKADNLDDGGSSDAMSISDDEEGDTSVLIIGKAT